MTTDWFTLKKPVEDIKLYTTGTDWTVVLVLAGKEADAIHFTVIDDMTNFHRFVKLFLEDIPVCSSDHRHVDIHERFLRQQTIVSENCVATTLVELEKSLRQPLDVRVTFDMRELRYTWRIEVPDGNVTRAGNWNQGYKDLNHTQNEIIRLYPKRRIIWILQ